MTSFDLLICFLKCYLLCIKFVQFFSLVDEVPVSTVAGVLHTGTDLNSSLSWIWMCRAVHRSWTMPNFEDEAVTVEKPGEDFPSSDVEVTSLNEDVTILEPPNMDTSRNVNPFAVLNSRPSSKSESEVADSASRGVDSVSNVNTVKVSGMVWHCLIGLLCRK